MRRREFIAGLAGALAGAPTLWPLSPSAQQGGPMRRVGVIRAGPQRDEQGQMLMAAFRQGLQKLGWTEGRNLAIDLRWGELDIERVRASAVELVALRPDVLFAGDTSALAALRPAARTIPIVFAMVSDPIGAGFVASLARPGGNITGFMPVEPPLAGKWVQLLKKIVPSLRRAAFLFNPELAPYAGEFFRHAEAAAAPLAVDLTAAAIHDDRDIEDFMTAFAREPDGGLINNPDAVATAHRQQIITLAARLRLPAIYPFRLFAAEGGLVSYGTDFIDQYRQAATYVDRILRGTKPADLPVQAPAKYELVINLRTARALNLDVSRDMFSIADEVIE